MGKTKKFRSTTGCVICLTKSSSSRFTNSERFAEHFVACFGQRARGRSGDLCNACVLHVKRHVQRPIIRRQVAGFEKVLDSKKGAGPKHMKQIAKRQRSREARLASTPISNNSTNHGSSQGQEISCNPTGNSARVDTRSKTQNQQVNVGRNALIITSSTASTSNEAPCYPIGGAESAGIVHLDDRNPPLLTEFRVPNSELPGRNRYRRNFTPPVKMSSQSQEEIDNLLRSIQARNSQAVNLDPREIHTYIYKQRLRNHSVAASTNVTSLCASSETFSHTDYQSIGSASFCSGDVPGFKN